MRKKNNEGHGVLFSPDLREVMIRLKGKEPELEEIVDHDLERGANEKRHEEIKED